MEVTSMLVTPPIIKVRRNWRKEQRDCSLVDIDRSKILASTDGKDLPW